MSRTSHSLTIVIPALNEESAIGDTIRRCLAARAPIRDQGGVDDVELICPLEPWLEHVPLEPSTEYSPPADRWVQKETKT